MNLLNSNGNKTLAPNRNIKESLLEKQIESLRSICQDSNQAFDEIVQILKKMINYRNQNKLEQRDEINIQNIFLEDLGDIEENLLEISEELQSDHCLYTSTATFRNSQKSIENECFQKIMKNYELFKEKISKRIHHLQKDIQLLQRNGYHIYTQVYQPNNVLNSLKKNSLQKYLIATNELRNICEMLKKRMDIKYHQTKRTKHYKSCIPYFRNKFQQNIKLLKNIFWKEIAHKEIMFRQVQKIKSQYKKQEKKIKITQNATKKVNQLIQLTQIDTNLFNQSQISKVKINKFLNNLKGHLNQNYILTSHLFDRKKNRSKSCHTIMTRAQKNSSMVMKKNKENEETNILGCDFLESSIDM